MQNDSLCNYVSPFKRSQKLNLQTLHDTKYLNDSGVLTLQQNYLFKYL